MAGEHTNRVLVLGAADIRPLLSFDEVVDAVRASYVALARGDASIFPLVREQLATGMFGLRSSYWEARDLLGLKMSGYYPANAARGRDNHQASVALLSPLTGTLQALVDGNYVTWIRTAAAGAVGSVALARSTARRVLVVGNGVQAAAQVVGHAAALADRETEFAVHAPRDPNGEKARAFAARLAEQAVEVSPQPSLRDGLSAADIVVTATTAREPILPEYWVRRGTHITAIGSDAPGKRELDPALVARARLVVDDREQSLRFGESQGLTLRAPPCSIGELLEGAMPERLDDEITIFDSTGIGLHDVVTASLAYAKAIERGVGTWISLE